LKKAMSKNRTGSTKKYRDQKRPCDERERLQQAFQRARQQEEEQADAAYKRAVSIDGGQGARATNQRASGGSRAAHILAELLAHERKHGCVPRFLPGMKDD
jgi:hypothetical protein